MLVSHKRKFIFTKTLKTAGSSVEVFFERHCVPDGVLRDQGEVSDVVSDAGIAGARGQAAREAKFKPHMSAEFIKKCIGESAWDSYFKFTTIRNPYDKLVSWFFFRYRMLFRSRPDEVEPGDLVRQFRALVKGGCPLPKDRDKYMIDGVPCLDYFIRYEALHEGLRHVCDRIGVPYDAYRVPRLKSKFRVSDMPFEEFYDQRTASVVQAEYAAEFTLFDYSHPDGIAYRPTRLSAGRLKKFLSMGFRRLRLRGPLSRGK